MAEAPKTRQKRKVQVWIHTPLATPGGMRVLLLRTRPERGHFWQPVTGGVKKSEEFFEGALREAWEETQLPFDGPPVELGYEFTFEGKWGPALERAYRLEATLDPGLQPGQPAFPRVKLSEEHDHFGWMTPPEALRRLKFESNQEALQRLVQALTGKALA
jgi:8-oxo-dGTP pyrophosphatase MutT (NUDIX family)